MCFTVTWDTHVIDIGVGLGLGVHYLGYPRTLAFEVLNFTHETDEKKKKS